MFVIIPDPPEFDVFVDDTRLLAVLTFGGTKRIGGFAGITFIFVIICCCCCCCCGCCFTTVIFLNVDVEAASDGISILIGFVKYGDEMFTLDGRVIVARVGVNIDAPGFLIFLPNAFAVSKSLPPP